MWVGAMARLLFVLVGVGGWCGMFDDYYDSNVYFCFIDH